MEDDFNDFSELSAGDTSIALRRCFAQVAAERDQLRAEVDRLRGEQDNAKLNWDLTQKRATKWAQELSAATARAEASEKEVERLRKLIDSIYA